MPSLRVAESMDLLHWAIGTDITYLASTYRDEAGQVWAGLAPGATVNLNTVEHLDMKILDVPRATGTWGDEIPLRDHSRSHVRDSSAGYPCIPQES